jgi:hypothetical protein
VNRFTWDANPMSDNRKFWWSELSKTRIRQMTH